MNDIQQRISEILDEHGTDDHRSAYTWSCECGADFHDFSTHTEHVAEVLVAELGLRQEWGNTWMGQGPAVNRSKGEAEQAVREFRVLFPNHSHDHHVVSRYITEWVPDVP